MMNFLCCVIAVARKYIILALAAMFACGVVLGFGLGVYFLPILTADAPADRAVLAEAEQSAGKQAVFKRDLPGSDFAHWGEGTLLLSDGRASLMGEVSPGPDYRLYLAPRYVETEEAFLAIKAQSKQLTSIKGFKDFSYEIEAGIDYGEYDAVVIWCEAFSQFITAGRLTDRQ